MTKPIMESNEFEIMLKNILNDVNRKIGCDFSFEPDAINYLAGIVESNFNVSFINKPKTLANIIVPEEIGIRDNSAIGDLIDKMIAAKIKKGIKTGSMLNINKEYNEEEDKDWSPGDE
jgi:hypothetical protein